MGAEDPLYGITRLDNEAAGTHGWQVRLQRKGVRHARFFSDSAAGGRDESLRRAAQFRDRLLRRLEDPGESVRVHTLTVRNTSGMVGVCRVVNVSAKGVEYISWQATWSPEPGRRKSVRFSVTLYGEEEAYRLACEARLKAVSGERE